VLFGIGLESAAVVSIREIFLDGDTGAQEAEEPIDKESQRFQWLALVGVCFACEGVFFELEMPKLMRKKRKPLRSESRMDMEGLFITIPHKTISGEVSPS
jgi:hypothetical protein